MHRKWNVQKLNALWEARGVWDSHVVVWHNWKSEDDGENPRDERPRILQTENKYLSNHHMAQSPMATPYPKLKRNVAYKTVFVKQVTSQGYMWKAAQWC